MKNYYCKYLPVEGEPKEGDITLLAGEVAPYNKIVPIGLKAANSQLKYQKVKLFLCSRDVKIGDKLYPLEGAEDQNEGAEMTCLQDVAVFKRNKAFKVIGEISPDAKWVKEGDEFDLTDFNPLSAAAIEHNKPIKAPIKIKNKDGNYY